MRIGINISIKQRIYWSFSLLVFLFVINGIITILTLNSNKKLATDIFKVIAPSIQVLEDFKKIMLESKMYTTNWVFLRSNQEDKKLLETIHDSGYAAVKSRVNVYASQWANKSWMDSLDKIYTDFEELLLIEKNIMGSLKTFKDYDDPVIKLEAERKVEEEILPRTSALMNALMNVHAFAESIRTAEGAKLEKSSMKLRMLIILLTITIICSGFFLSVYMTRIIVRPVNRISDIISNLGRGVIQRIDHYHTRNEIGKMVESVNSLSKKLQTTANFAQEIGLRNFDMPFKALGEEDTLGKALIMMRDNIKSSDEKLNQAQHIAHIGNLEKDIITGDMYISDEMYTILDIDRATSGVSFQDIVNLVHPDDLDYFNNVRNKYLSDHQPVDYECRIITTKGITKNILVHSKVILDAQGKITRIVGILQDITERKKAEEALSNNELRFRTLTGSAPVGIFQTDIEGKTIYVNETWLEYTGMSFNEAMGYGWLAAVHPVDREIMQKEWNDRSEKGVESSTEYRLVNKKGNIRWVMGKAVPIFNKRGEILGHIGTVSDITERKLAIESLQQSEMKYRQIVETAQEGIWLIDENNYTIFVNKKMCLLLEYSQEEMMGKQNYYFKDEEEKKKAAAQIGRRKQGISEPNDAKFITKSGKTVWTRVSTNPVFDEAGIYKGALAMVTDITQRKLDDELLHQSEVNLAVKNKELESKNKELEQFAYVASHDMQEPLRTTSSFVELLQQQYQGRLDEKADKYLSFIAQSSDRMKVLIKDLLDYSRIGRTKKLKQVNCEQTLAEVLADLDLAIKETQAVITADALPFIDGYPTEVKQLFQNLIMNSIKFRKKTVSPQIKISVKKVKDNWEFAFKDNGIGIDERHSERIFIIFQRLHTRTEYEGSGIGLAHCKKIVELHNGKIWFNSKPGEGTTFYFTIPQHNS